MVRASRTTLAPVYAPLAEYLARHLDLAANSGIGIDVGSGPGTLIVELRKRTSMQWINADINSHFFPHFYKLARENGIHSGINAIRADVHDMPFRDNYADVIISRGSYWSWDDKPAAFAEIYRVLKPGGVAYIGRGFSPNLDLETATAIRKKQGKSMKYSFDAKAAELTEIMQQAGVEEYKIHDPSAAHDKRINYGIWIEFRKP